MPRSLVLQLIREIDTTPVADSGVIDELRTLELPRDEAGWLELRNRAFAGEVPTVRPWNSADFRREMIAQPWWNPERTWVIDAPGLPGRMVGAVTMALRASDRAHTPAIHWLMVDPEFRGLGWGRSLIAALERAAYNDGYRQVVLETHVNWRSAVALYQRLGYQQRRQS
ncbi:MAG: GNAT family N-acetyltransferase [Planctomycetales bacterium]|nr:GNAT family N-acetyltransferase [Planctomycetales bacterium]